MGRDPRFLFPRSAFKFQSDMYIYLRWMELLVGNVEDLGGTGIANVCGLGIGYMTRRMGGCEVKK